MSKNKFNYLIYVVAFYQNRQNLKWYYDRNSDYSIWAILRRKQVVGVRSKITFAFLKYIFSFQRYWSF